MLSLRYLARRASRADQFRTNWTGTSPAAGSTWVTRNRFPSDPRGPATGASERPSFVGGPISIASPTRVTGAAITSWDWRKKISRDDVLKGVAGLLRQRLRQTDVVARLGGDEFAVLLPQADADHAQSVADEVVKALGRQAAVLADQSIRITASIGVSMFDGLTDTEILAYADLAMYEAKETGRNRFAMYRPATGGKARGSTRLVEAERIRHALEEDRLILYCQPILDLSTNEISQYELLLRLPDEDRGEPLPPSAFLYGAERFGLIQAIDGWVVRKAIALIAEHERAGLKLVLNVNLSGKSIGDRKLVALIEEALAEAGIDPARLTFELTETAAIANVEEAKAFASRLRGRGCQFALDDFGAGFGSFYYLKNFPFD